MRANINLHNIDCMEAMKDMKDNQYDLAIDKTSLIVYTISLWKI